MNELSTERILEIAQQIGSVYTHRIIGDGYDTSLNEGIWTHFMPFQQPSAPKGT